jgi:hypothetical protein
MPTLQCAGNAIDPVEHGFHGKALALQVLAQQGAQLGVVIDQQDTGRVVGHRLPWRIGDVLRDVTLPFRKLYARVGSLDPQAAPPGP